MTNEPTSIGGAATNKGIWFQALWIVLQAAASRVGINVVSDSNGPDEILRLVLEPHGGDVRIEYQNNRRVVQLKVKNHGTWALKDLITEVLPDLYRAVDVGHDNATYEFVTEGRQGQWRAALTFFNGLGGRLYGEHFDDAYAELRTNITIRFDHQIGEFWQVSDDTEKGLFDRIVSVLRGPEPEKGKPDNRELLDDVRRKAWHLLARLRFSGSHSPESVRREVEQTLMRVVPQREKLRELCNAMGGWICDRSSTNNNTITPAELFAVQGLDKVTPIGDLLVLRRRSREKLMGQLDKLGYEPAWDVRRSPDETSDQTSTAITAITGGNGEGKSWRVYAAADVAQTAAAILIESSGSITRDLQQAADDLWQGVLGHDASKPVANIAEHLRDVLGAARGDPWLTICLDRVEDVAVANALLIQPLEEWGVRVVVGCEPQVAARLEQTAKTGASKVLVKRVSAFSTDELHRYLGFRLGEGYARVPADVRDLLRNPQLAALYGDLVTADVPPLANGNNASWQPQNEYDLVRHFWDRLDGAQALPNSTDALRLKTLAGEVLDGKPYPWTLDRLDAARLDDDAIGRLMRLGWLRRTAGRNGFEVPHDRLLGHAVARSLIARCVEQSLTADAVTDALAGATEGPYTRRLGYLLMDWFDLATRDDQLRPLTHEVLRLYGNKGDHHVREQLHQRLLPTLGPAAIPLLINRLYDLAENADLYEVVPVVKGIADSLPEDGSSAARDTVLSLLNDKRPKVRRAGLRLMRIRPVPEGLDPAWRLHQEMQVDPTAYAGEGASSRLLYEDSFDALRAATRLHSEWLDRAIQQADPAIEPVADLAYLVANLNDGGNVWRNRKIDLLAKVTADKVRSLATNIGHWRDGDEVNRLEEWARKDRASDPDLAAPAAVRAMARIDAKRAAELLQQMTPQTLYLCRGWFLPRLLSAEGSATRDALFSVISRAGNPLQEALVYEGNANDMDVRTLELLLDNLDQRLAELLAAEQEEDRVNLFIEFNLLAEIGRSELLNVFARRVGTSLEDRLTEFLIRIIGPQRGRFRSNPEREPALTVLLRINGDVFSHVLRAYLANDDVWAKLNAVQWAKWYASADLLADIAESASADYPADVDPTVLRFEAARLLAGHGDFVGLLKVIQVMGQMPADLPDWVPESPANQCHLPAEAVASVRKDSGTVLHVSLLVLGLAQFEGVVDDALQILKSTGDKATRIAAIETIGLARRGDDKSVSAIMKYLRDDSLRFAAVQALGRIRGAQADAALSASLSYAWNDQLAVFLAANTEHRNQIVPELAARISQSIAQKKRSAIGRDTLSVVLGAAPDALLDEIIRTCETSVHDHLRETAIGLEGSFWVVGSKRSAIRGLSFIDPDAARVAATVALESRDTQDRPLYPAILYRLASRAARELFLRLASDEPDDAALAAMAYALAPEADAEWLCACLQATQDPVRIAACRLAAGSCGDHPTVEESLRSTIDDPSTEVADAAVLALRHVHRQRQAESLIADLPTDAPQARVAAILQGAITVGDAGFEGGAWPKWTKRLFESSCLRHFPPVLHVAEKEIGQSRKKAADEAKNDAKRR